LGWGNPGGRRLFRAAGVSIVFSLGTDPVTEGLVASTRCPIPGRVSMDLVAIDVTDIPNGGVKRGNLATKIGDEISVDDLATAAGTIGYEVLTSLGKRYHRVYRAN